MFLKRCSRLDISIVTGILLHHCMWMADYRAMEIAGGAFWQRRRVFLVPSDDIRWTVVETMLRAMADVAVIGKVTNVADAREEIAKLHPDAVIAAGIVGGESVQTFLTEMRHICGPTTRLVVLATDYIPQMCCRSRGSGSRPTTCGKTSPATRSIAALEPCS